MLNKILSNLHFNPDYLSLLKEYQNKQSREKYIRGFGFLFIALAFLVQVFAYSPLTAQTNASASLNDLIPGGVTSKQQLINDCNSNYHYVALIYGYYGVSCKDITSSNSSVITLSSTSYGGNLWSVGHLPYDLPGETPVNILGATVYWRYLHGWDKYGYASYYTALQVRADNGRTYFILFTCGNLVSIGFPPPYLPPKPPTPPPTPPPKPPKPPKPPAPCIYNSGLPATSPECKPCTNAQDTTDVVACLVYSKFAANLTQQISNANNTTASPGDEIQYTLRVQNIGKAVVKNFVIQENLSDVLDYSSLDHSNGVVLGPLNILSWPPVNIAPREIITKQFNVTVKNPLPQIALNPDDPQGYNNVMTNVYGNAINIAVKPNAIVTIANTANTLPNTGPGTSIFIIFMVTAVAGYFYSRARLLNKESLIAESIISLGDRK